MSDWIPTAERLPIQDGPARRVLAQDKCDNRYIVDSQLVNLDFVAWQEMPEPYIPTKPKRRRGTMWVPKHEPGHIAPNDKIDAIEVFPGDPDPDVVLNVLSEMKVADEREDQDVPIRWWIKRIEESRSK